MDFIALDDCCGERSGDRALGAAVCGIDDADAAAFEFCCVGHGVLVWFDVDVSGHIEADWRRTRDLLPKGVDSGC